MGMGSMTGTAVTFYMTSKTSCFVFRRRHGGMLLQKGNRMRHHHPMAVKTPAVVFVTARTSLFIAESEFTVPINEIPSVRKADTMTSCTEVIAMTSAAGIPISHRM